MTVSFAHFKQPICIIFKIKILAVPRKKRKEIEKKERRDVAKTQIRVKTQGNNTNTHTGEKLCEE